MKRGPACGGIDLDAVEWNRDDPEDSRLAESGIVGMRAQRARCQEAVNSYKGESAAAQGSNRVHEFADHESQICVEHVLTGIAVAIGPRPGQRHCGRSEEHT